MAYSRKRVAKRPVRRAKTTRSKKAAKTVIIKI